MRDEAGVERGPAAAARSRRCLGPMPARQIPYSALVWTKTSRQHSHRVQQNQSSGETAEHATNAPCGHRDQQRHVRISSGADTSPPGASSWCRYRCQLGFLHSGDFCRPACVPRHRLERGAYMLSLADRFITAIEYALRHCGSRCASDRVPFKDSSSRGAYVSKLLAILEGCTEPTRLSPLRTCPSCGHTLPTTH